MSKTGRFLRFVGVVLLLLLIFATGWLTGTARVGSRVARTSLSDLERQFADRMSGAALVGRFTIAGRDDRPASPERYELSSVDKVGDNEWRFNARIKYASFDVTLPIVVTMLWAGDTPMITITDFAIPPLGTFTARVFFYGDRYVGTWQHGNVGGHMFGKIEKTAAAEGR
jgi:hypothetical protein